MTFKKELVFKTFAACSNLIRWNTRIQKQPYITRLVSTTIKKKQRKTYCNSFRDTCLTSDQLFDIFFLNRWQLKPFVKSHLVLLQIRDKQLIAITSNWKKWFIGKDNYLQFRGNRYIKLYDSHWQNKTKSMSKIVFPTWFYPHKGHTVHPSIRDYKYRRTIVRLFNLELCKLFCSLVRSRSSEQ